MSKVSFENYDLAGVEKKYPAGKVLIHENELSRKLFIVKAGNVRVFKIYLSQKKRGTVYHIEPDLAFETFTYQSLLKNFDHTIFNVDRV